MAGEDKGELGSINVEMGDGNTVGHIGHIVFHEPPPDPNSIWYGGIVIGSIAPGVQRLDEQTYLFPKLFTDRRLAIGAEVQIQGLKLRLLSVSGVATSSIGGRPPQVTLSNATCEIIPEA